MTASPVLTLREACAYLRRGRTWMKANADAIGVVRDGGPLLFKQADLDAWLERHRVQEGPRVVTLPARPAPRTNVPEHLRGRINPVTRRPYGSAAR